MKNSPAQILQGRITQFQRARADIAAFDARLSESESQLASLSASGDLDDEAVLNQIARLQVFTKLFPARIEALNKAHDSGVDDLKTACCQFINQELNPRAHDLAARVRELVGAKLKEHFQDKTALSAAVEKSALVNEANKIKAAVNFARESGVLNFDADALIGRAESLLTLWQSADEFEAKLANQP
jgi:hypothetical protein